MEDITCAYLAGILDGEGSIMLYKTHQNTHPAPVVSVTTTDRELADWLKDNFGGQIVNQKIYQAHHKQAWVWKVTNQKALAVLLLARAYMKIERKGRKADLLLYDYAECTSRNGKYTEEMLTKKQALYEQFRAL
jgi:hypothetical protein